MVSLVFAMQAAGLVFGPLLAAGAARPLSRTIWSGGCCSRFGAVPAMAVFQLRRQMARDAALPACAGQHEDFYGRSG